MDREHIAYQIFYSYLLERMTSKLNDRISKALSFLLLILGSTVISSHFNPVLVGLTITIISAINTVCSFSASAELARVQSSRYLKLYNCLHTIKSDEDLMHQLIKIQEDDKIPNPTLARLAERESGMTFEDFKVSGLPSKKEKLYSFFVN